MRLRSLTNHEERESVASLEQERPPLRDRIRVPLRDKLP
jgi:hypothetical protein